MTLHERAAFRHLDRRQNKDGRRQGAGAVFFGVRDSKSTVASAYFWYGDNRSMQLRRRVQTL